MLISTFYLYNAPDASSLTSIVRDCQKVNRQAVMMFAPPKRRHILCLIR
jgi:hypothetical protein